MTERRGSTPLPTHERPAVPPAAPQRTSQVRRILRGILWSVAVLAVLTGLLLWWLLPIGEPDVQMDRSAIVVENTPSSTLGIPEPGPLRVRIPLAVTNPNAVGATLTRLDADLYWNGTIPLGRVLFEEPQAVEPRGRSSLVLEYEVPDLQAALGGGLPTAAFPGGEVSLLPDSFNLTVVGNATVALPLGAGEFTLPFNLTEPLQAAPPAPTIRSPLPGSAVGPGPVDLEADIAHAGVNAFVAWYDIGGPEPLLLGLGRAFPAAALAPGNHTLAVVAYTGFHLTWSEPVTTCVRPHEACPLPAPSGVLGGGEG